MRNPLEKRVPKELKSEWRKYFVIFLFLTIIIGFVSGMYVANDSMLKSFEEGYLSLLKEINNFCLFYEHNKKLIESLNLELSNNLTYDDRIYDNYVFEEYMPKFKNIKDQADMAVIQKMNELIGFEFDKIKPNNLL